MATTIKPIRVFLLDDHEIVRRGLADLISLENDMEVLVKLRRKPRRSVVFRHHAQQLLS
jgi:DNA-binding NarL/FixJ family response regulator